MLTCHACMKRYLQNLIGDSAVLSSSRGPHLATGHTRQLFKRNFTPASTQRSDSSRDLTKPLNPKNSIVSFAPGRNFKNGVLSMSHTRQEWLESRGFRPIHKRRDGPVIKKHLTYLKDPLKLGEYVRKSLRQDDFDSILEIVRAASKDVQCIVSWNHLIDWQLSKGRMNSAIRTYNEMKKRAQAPDAHTYTIIFRGCAEHPDPVQALAKVISVYNSMLIDKSAIKPNTIHMNAVLKMCARARDMHALFAIAAQLPTKGVRAPNNLTYTTIINAIRIHALVNLRSDLTPVQNRANRQKAILDARRLWEDITKRWRQGDIWIDEELVCAMGRILLLGVDRDIDDVLSLVEQSMDVPRQVPRLGSPDRKKIEPRSQGQVQTGQLDGKEFMVAEHEPALAIEELKATPVDQFQAISHTQLPKTAASAYARPGQNALSLIMQALLNLRLKEPATKYWTHFTEDLGVKPDADNFHAYLRILRMARASTETVDLLLRMPKHDMEMKTFRIAMVTCERDKKNQHAFSNAGKILDMMQSAIEAPDIPTLQMYLDVAISATTYNDNMHSNGKIMPSKLAQGKQILRALYRINPSFVNLRSLIAYGDPAQKPQTRLEKASFVDSVVQLTQKMVRANDLLMNQAMVDRSMYVHLTKERSKLAAFITRYKHKTDNLPAPTRRDQDYPVDLGS